MNNNCEINKKISEYISNQEKFLLIIDFDRDNIHIYSPEEAFEKRIYFDFSGATNCGNLKESFVASKNAPKKLLVKQISYNDYLKSFNRIQYHLKRGDSYLINLTFKTEIETDYSLDEIFFLSQAKYKLLFKDYFVVFSPETFVRIYNGKISSYPMKGTINAQTSNAEEELLSNEKELNEHNTIVDLIRNDLNIISNNVRVTRFRYLDRLKTNKGEIIQASSEIVGDLPDDYKEKFPDIILKLLPAGSISGAPKKKTIEIINNVESYKRGYYTGICGFFDGKKFDSAVMIRFIEKDVSGKMFFKSGGGITHQSCSKSEYNELLDKIYVPIV